MRLQIVYTDIIVFRQYFRFSNLPRMRMDRLISNLSIVAANTQITCDAHK